MAKNNTVITPRTLLYRAARIIAARADEIKTSETIVQAGAERNRDWSLAAAMAKQEYDELRTMATELRRLARTYRL